MSVSDRSSRRKKSISSISEVSAHQKEAVPVDTKTKNVNNETNSTDNKNSNNMNWVSKSEPIGLRLLQAIEYKPLEEKDLFGLKVSKRAIKYLSPAEIRDLYDVFSTFDRRSSGYLKAKDLYYALRVLGFTSSESICQELIESDGDPQNGLHFNQFLDLIIDKQDSSKDCYDEIQTVFKLFDYDNTEHISIENLRRACIDTNLELTETELKEMIAEADQNGDGLIDQSEFIAMMMKTNLY